MRVVGLISGTSVDGIDVAVADLSVSGDEIVLVPLGHSSVPYPDDLRRDLLAVLPPSATTVARVTRLDTRVGQTFAEAAATLSAGADLVASLGQTVFHWVSDGRARGSLQLGQPAWIAERTGLPVVADLRVRDIATGGHGAPLASTLDALWLRDLAPAVALNIGGIANVTVVRADGVQAFDTGPGNALLDLAAHEVTNGAQDSDLDGAIAARGHVHTELLDRLLAEPYYAAPPPKSTGKELFHADYLHAATAGLDLTAEDLLATLTELTAVTIARACADATTVITSGGGADNPALMRALAAHLPGTRLAVSDEFGLPREAKESYLTALLGFLTWHGIPANLPSATGARGPRLLGSITPGENPLGLPAPHPVAVTRLRVAAHPDQPIGVPDAPS
ncbi:anhydro-N-acetylmuramic acid kinase [Amycolatopsis endophytica]|uniref:Anhydro-N-acetylmuramic acid kinase n=1 Tax=Amycolatopsis endophytica TaxID=860233 RepID=A0A853AW74_9PSEU|nr:anhydro-N-acetylmuramic acid kinase [Amycolatopsis endophytica]NYI86940.1 anhydro-N-acetylmuramic acid kinase [Amycolatopsis endophytica]